MNEYQTILDRLDRRQKIALLTDLASLSDSNIDRAGVPAVRMASLDELNRERGLFPAYRELAVSWDESLVGAVTQELAVPARGTGRNLLETPDLKCASCSAADGLSEDAVLNAALGTAMARAAHRSGCACALSRLAVSENDISPLDVREDPRAVHELFLKPFLGVMEEERCEAVVSSLKREGGGYADCNTKLFGAAAGGIREWDAFPIADGISSDVDYHGMLAHGLCLKGASVFLDRAAGRYERLSRSLEAGSVSERELRGAIEDGTAVDPALIDAAADRAIAFAHRVAGRKAEPLRTENAGALARRAAEESFVLLKNEGLLPLAQTAKLAVVGEAYELFPAGNAFPVVMRAEMPGRDAGGEPVPSIVRDASQADVILLFFKMEEGKNGPALPAEQVALAHALKSVKRPMIAVVKGSVPPDAGVFRLFSAALLAPSSGKYCAEAMTDLLNGNSSPSGRLTRSCYENADAFFQMLEEDKRSGRTKVGPFVGYRYYDTARLKVKYPFGYGLTYTRFCYSSLSLEGDTVSFTVKNTGKNRGCEVVQVYVGTLPAAFPQPKKRLAAFERVELSPGESRRVTLTVPEKKYASFCERTLGERVVKGSYPVYVGASVSDIRLRGIRSLDGEAPTAPSARPCEYFRDLSNIDEKYHAGVGDAMSRPRKNFLLRGVAFFVLIAALAIAVIMGCAFFSDRYLSVSEIVWLSVMGAFALGAAVTLGIENYIRQDKLLSERGARKALVFPDAIETVKDAAAVFEAELPSSAADALSAAGTDEPKYFDASLTFDRMTREFALFLNERGIGVSRQETADLIAALSTTHLIVLPGVGEKAANVFLKAVSDYFGTRLYADNFADGDFFRRRTKYGWENTSLCEAMRDARANLPLVHVALLRGVEEDALAGLSFARRAGRTGASLEEEAGASSFPPNLWVFVLPQEEVRSFPAEIAEIASFLPLSLEEGRAAQTPTHVTPFGYYQFANLCARVREGFPLREQAWKRFDSLESRLGSGSRPYRFGNRTWIKLEMHVSVCLACGKSEAEAVDSAIASELLIGIAPFLSGEDGGGLALLEELFGSEEIACCRKLAEKIKLFRHAENEWEGSTNA